MRIRGLVYSRLRNIIQQIGFCCGPLQSFTRGEELLRTLRCRPSLYEAVDDAMQTIEKNAFQVNYIYSIWKECLGN